MLAKDKPDAGSWLGIKLSGTMTQFNIMVLLSVLIIGFLFVAINKLSDKIILYSGNILLAALLCFVIIFSFIFFFKQKSRSLDGAPPVIEVNGQNGSRALFVNPPDSVYELTDERNVVVRALMVGYDRNLCPDGEVIGNASEKKFREYSEEEKSNFKQKHIQEIHGMRNAIRNMCNENQIEEEKGL